MPQTSFDIPDSAFNCVCGSKPKGCITVGAGKTEYHVEHFGCRMNTIRMRSEHAACSEWDRIVQIKLYDNQQSNIGATDDNTVSSIRRLHQGSTRG